VGSKSDARSITVPVVAKTSAGILLYRGEGDSLEVLLVHPGGPFWAKKDEGAWSIPKGELDEGEEPRACALRELEEEIGSSLGLVPEQLGELGEVRLKSGKRVLGWAAEGDFDPSTLRSNSFEMEWPPRSGKRGEFPEVDRAEWFALALARLKINPAQAAFIDRLLAR
jgi:predicted NUDIX family NTP pyrophosphohydrolase